MKKALLISIIYLLFGILWIYVGDNVLFKVMEDSDELYKISRNKGFIFVFITTIFIIIILLHFYNYIKKLNNKVDILFSNKDIGYLQVSETGQIIDINSNIAEKLGYTRKELLRKYTGDLTHKDDFKEDTLQWEILKQDHTSIYKRTKRYIHKSGKPVWVKIIGKMVKDFKGKPYFIASVIDITEKKNAEIQISHELKEKEALMNNTPDLVWSVDKNIQLNSFNLAYNQLLKKHYGKRPRTGDFILDKYVDKKEKQFWLQAYLRALNNEYFSVTDRQLFHGKVVYFKTSFNPIIANHKVVGIACASKDITEEQSIIDTLRETISAKETSEEVFEEIFENIPVMIAIYDPKENTLQLNQELLQTFGLEKGKAYNLEILNKVVDNPEVVEELKRNLTKHFNNWKDFKVTTANGEKKKQKWINLLLKHNRSLSIGIDIKRLKQNTNNTKKSKTTELPDTNKEQ